MKSILALVLLGTLALAQQPPRRPGAPPLPPGTEVRRDVEYVPGGGPRRMLDVYFPAKAEKPLPLVVWIHGGGWRAGSKDRTQALPLLADGFVVASVTYRFSQDAPFPAQIEDCRAAIRWLRAHAAEFHIDPARVGVWGSSAGGHLVAMLGTAGDRKEWDKGENLDHSARVQAVCDWFGPSELLTMGAQSGPNTRIQHDAPDSPEASLVGGALQENKEKARAASPITYVTPDDPPFLIMHGDSDLLVPHEQSVRLDDALKKAGVDSRLETLKGSGHGDGAFRTPESFAKVREFFLRTLKK
jgi:acetyl esterase/lipase